MVREGDNIHIIEWDDLDKSKFFGFGIVLSTTMRTIVYPTQLVKTNLQSQVLGKSQYKGFIDAIFKIYRTEGFRGYYKGLTLNLMQVPLTQLYLSVFEKTKYQLSIYVPTINITYQHFISGLIASSISQMIATPLDVVTQYKQVLNAPSISKNQQITAKSTLKIVKQLYKSDGIINGFYRGFSVGTSTYALSSGIIWAMYYSWLEIVGKIQFLKILCKDGQDSKDRIQNDKTRTEQATNTELTKYKITQIMLAGTISSLITNIFLLPLDTIRTRHQLQLSKQKTAKSENSVIKTITILYKEEKLYGFFRGWSPRVVQSITTSGLIFLGYEYLKVTASKST